MAYAAVCAIMQQKAKATPVMQQFAITEAAVCSQKTLCKGACRANLMQGSIGRTYEDPNHAMHQGPELPL